MRVCWPAKPEAPRSSGLLVLNMLIDCSPCAGYALRMNGDQLPMKINNDDENVARQNP